MGKSGASFLPAVVYPTSEQQPTKILESEIQLRLYFLSKDPRISKEISISQQYPRCFFSNKTIHPFYQPFLLSITWNGWFIFTRNNI